MISYNTRYKLTAAFQTITGLLGCWALWEHKWWVGVYFVCAVAVYLYKRKWGFDF